MPKEMLPVVDRPADPARGGRGAPGRHRAFHLRHRPQQGGDRGSLRSPVRARADADRAQAQGRPRAACRATLPGAGQTSFTRQQLPLGLGHAVWCARELVGHEPFALLLPDVLVQAERGCLAQMIDACAHLPAKSNVIAVEEVPMDRVHMYGVVGVGEAHGDAFADHPHGGEAARAAMRRRTSSSPAATSCSRRSSTSSPTRPAAPAAKSSSPTR